MYILVYIYILYIIILYIIYIMIQYMKRTCPKMPKVFASKMQIHRVINTTKANCVQLHVGLQGSRKAQRCVKSKGSCLRLALKSFKFCCFLSNILEHLWTSTNQCATLRHVFLTLERTDCSVDHNVCSPQLEAESKDYNMMTVDSVDP